MKIFAGELISWPDHPFKADGHGLMVVISGFTILRVPVGIVLPGLPRETVTALPLQLRTAQDVTFLREEIPDASRGNAWLEDQLCTLLKQLNSNLVHDQSGNICGLFEALSFELIHRHDERLASHLALDQSTATELFRHLESDDALNSSLIGVSHQDDALMRCIALIRGRTAHAAISVGSDSSNSRRYLQHLLESNGLIGRDVVMNERQLQQNCGDLIAFFEEDRDSPALLQSKKNGYMLWAPESMPHPIPVADCRTILSKLSPRMVAISPGLMRQDLTTPGLLRFAFGKPREITQFIVIGLLLGLALGFLLSIGREVGAARWVFCMAASGAGLGTCLGLLSGGFRSGVAVMVLATFLAMLTPAFNTAIANQALPDRDLSLLLQISMLLFVGGITRVGLEWVQSRDVLLTQQSGAARIQLAGMQRVLSLPIDFFRHRTVGELQLRFGALEELRKEIRVLMEGGLVKFLLTSLYLLFLLRISVKLTVLAVVLAGLIVLPTAIMAVQSRSLQRRQETAKAAAQSRNLELISSVSKLRIAGAEAAAAQWWAGRFKQVIALENSLDAKQATVKLLQAVMPNLGTLLVYIMITKLISEASNSAILNAPNVGQQLGFLAAFGTFIGGIAGLAGLLSGAFDLPIIYERFRPMLDANVESDDDHQEAGILRGDIQIDRVSYRYSEDRPLVLDSVSFEAKAGEYVAIVGPSGSGKSTLVRLLLGFAAPEDGVIRLDGQPLSGLELRSVRRQIGTVLQTNSLFSGSLIEVIAGGAVIQEEEAWHAAELAGLADEIREMPMGMQTVIPDGGGTLSGGQRQRVGIARALVRKPRLLIFDEATSALDNHTQAIVSNSLEKLSITRLVIAHRLSTIRHADRIVVLDQGQVQEQGNYDALINSKGVFARLMERQIQ